MRPAYFLAVFFATAIVVVVKFKAILNFLVAHGWIITELAEMESKVRIRGGAFMEVYFQGAGHQMLNREIRSPKGRIYRKWNVFPTTTKVVVDTVECVEVTRYGETFTIPLAFFFPPAPAWMGGYRFIGPYFGILSLFGIDKIGTTEHQWEDIHQEVIVEEGERKIIDVPELRKGIIQSARVQADVTRVTITGVETGADDAGVIIPIDVPVLADIMVVNHWRAWHGIKHWTEGYKADIEQVVGEIFRAVSYEDATRFRKQLARQLSMKQEFLYYLEFKYGIYLVETKDEDNMPTVFRFGNIQASGPQAKKIREAQMEKQLADRKAAAGISLAKGKAKEIELLGAARAKAIRMENAAVEAYGETGIAVRASEAIEKSQNLIVVGDTVSAIVGKFLKEEKGGK